jgi:hypothetical protein
MPNTTMIGTVESVTLSGLGANSGEILVAFQPSDGGARAPYAVYSDAMPGVFAGLLTMLLTAYRSKLEVSMSWNSDTHVDVPEIYQVQFPAK